MAAAGLVELALLCVYQIQTLQFSPDKHCLHQKCQEKFCAISSLIHSTEVGNNCT